MTIEILYSSAYYVFVAFAGAVFTGFLTGVIVSVVGTLFRGRRGKFYERNTSL